MSGAMGFNFNPFASNSPIPRPGKSVLRDPLTTGTPKPSPCIPSVMAAGSRRRSCRPAPTGPPGRGWPVDARSAGPGKCAQPVRREKLVAEGRQFAGSIASGRRGTTPFEKLNPLERSEYYEPRNTSYPQGPRQARRGRARFGGGHRRCGGEKLGKPASVWPRHWSVARKSMTA